MLRHCAKISNSLKRLRADKDGVVSFEYIIVATCITGAVVAVFTSSGSSSLSGVLTSMLSAILSRIPA